MSSGGRPATAPPAEVEVALDDRVLGTVVAGESLQSFAFDLPADHVETLAAAGEPVRVRIRVASWNPADLLGAPDTRDLGVMVSGVALQ